MEFSPCLSVSKGLVAWSPDGRFLAHAVQSRLIVRDSATLKVITSNCCIGNVDLMDWSPCSEFVAAGVTEVGVTHVFCVQDPNWTAKIAEGPVGLESIQFSPDSRHVLCTSSLGLKLTIWSLSSKQVRYIRFPKASDFSNDGALLAVVEKTDNGKEMIGIYDCETWENVNRFRTDCSDISGVKWSPNSDLLTVWSGPLKYSVQVYKANGECVMKIEPEEISLGVKQVLWSPCGQVLAVAGMDHKISLFNTLTSALIMNLEHKARISVDCYRKTQVFEERYRETDSIDQRIVRDWLNVQDSYYECIRERPVILARLKVDPKKPNPKVGVSLAKFSANGQYLATVEDSIPTAVFVWNIQNLELVSVLVHKDPVVSLDWEPEGLTRLVITTGGLMAFVWSPLGAIVIQLPAFEEGDLHPSQVSWNPLGKALFFAGKDRMVCSKVVKTGRNKIK